MDRRDLSATDRAYIAGIVDGEGTISLHKRGGKYRYPYVSVGSTSSAIIDYLKCTVGGYVTKRRKVKPSHLEARVWIVEFNHSLWLLRQIFPHLKEEGKRRRAGLLLTEYDQTISRNGKYTPEQMARRLAFASKFFNISRGTRGSRRKVAV